jgi:hypothetical protein
VQILGAKTLCFFFSNDGLGMDGVCRPCVRKLYVAMHVIMDESSYMTVKGSDCSVMGSSMFEGGSLRTVMIAAWQDLP